MNINTRNYDDFKKVVSKLDSIVGRASFRDMSINDLEYLFNWAIDVENEWNHLESDIDDWLEILDEVEENN